MVIAKYSWIEEDLFQSIQNYWAGTVLRWHRCYMLSQTTFIDIICCLGFVIYMYIFHNLLYTYVSVSENEFCLGCKSITTDSSELEIGSKEKFT